MESDLVIIIFDEGCTQNPCNKPGKKLETAPQRPLNGAQAPPERPQVILNAAQAAIEQKNK